MAEFTARAYQQKAIDWVLQNPRCALWADMGLGKTVATLTAISILLEVGLVSRVLVVAPKRVAMVTWPDEVAKWSHLHHLRPTVVMGTPNERQAKLADGADIHIINYDNIPWLLDKLQGDWPYDMVVLDESTKVKAHDSIRFKGKPTRKTRDAAGKLVTRKGHPGLKWASERTSRWVNLTGTPAPNGMLDLFTQTYFLDGGARLAKTYSYYRERFFTSDYMGYNWELKPGAKAQITGLLKDLCLTISGDDYLDLPPLVESVVPIRFDKKTAHAYRDLQREFVLHLDVADVIAANAAVLSGKLLQFTAGALYLETGGYDVVHNEKLDALEELLEEAAGPVLIAYNFQSDLERMQDRIPHLRVLDDKPGTIADWNAGSIPAMAIHPRSCGHGLNLQHGGNQMIFYSVDWDLESHQQVIERIGPTRQYQAGLDRPCFVHYLIAEGTIDELVLERLRTKASVQDVLKNAMKTRSEFQPTGLK